MQIDTLLAHMRRPKILVRAARLGLAQMEPDVDFRRVLGSLRGGSTAALVRREEELENDRRTGEASYSVHDHIRVLTALLFEARRPQSG